MSRLIKANQDLLSAIAKDYRIELAREFSAKPSAEVETVATMIKNRMDALRGYGSAQTTVRPTPRLTVDSTWRRPAKRRRTTIEAQLMAINEAQKLQRLFWRKLPAVLVPDGAEAVTPVMLGLGKTTLAVVSHPNTYQVRHEDPGRRCQRRQGAGTGPSV